MEEQFIYILLHLNYTKLINIHLKSNFTYNIFLNLLWIFSEILLNFNYGIKSIFIKVVPKSVNFYLLHFLSFI